MEDAFDAVREKADALGDSFAVAAERFEAAAAEVGDAARRVEGESPLRGTKGARLVSMVAETETVVAAAACCEGLIRGQEG